MSWADGFGTAFPVNSFASHSYGVLTKEICRPGDVKDFLKKVKMEDQRIELRKKTLIQKKLAEQRRALPQQKKEETPPVKLEVPTKTEEPSTSKPSTPAPPDTLTPSQPTNVTGSPLHPSLPAKPGSVPSKVPPSQDVEMSEASTTPAPTPAPEVVPAEPKPVQIPPDPLISKYEEVSIFYSFIVVM